MGDTACLMQPFCYASGISNEANQSNPVHALGHSISFGRFVSESIAWEKWSSFSHNRYVEEAERYSRPGSVAQKKAFFEAHYKKLAAQRAAALLEQENNAASNKVTKHGHEAVVDNNHNSQTTSPNVKLVNERPDFKVLNSRPETRSSISNGCRSNSNTDPGKRETENQPFVGKSVKVELKSHLENVDAHEEVSQKVSLTPPVHTPISKSFNSDKENIASVSKKKPSVSSSKLMKATETSKFTSTPVKATVSVYSKNDPFASPASKKPALRSTENRSPPKSLHMSNFTPIRELNRLTASVKKKFERARVGAASSEASKDRSSTPLRTPTMASKNEGQNHSSMTPLTEKIRKKMKSPVISSPFNLRTEERAARRKKKLEEKFNSNEAQKVQLHTKLKEKAETEIRKLRESFCFKARPLPEFYKERKESKKEIKMGTLTQVESPKQGRKVIPSMRESKTPLAPQRGSVKNNGFNSRTPTHPLASNSIMNMRVHRQIFGMGTKMTDFTK